MVLVELLVSLLQVAALGFVLPGEEAAFPNVREPGLGGSRFGDPLLIGVAGSDLVGFGRVGTSRTSQRSRKCCGAAERSVRVLASHLRTKFRRSMGIAADGYCAGEIACQVPEAGKVLNTNHLQLA